MKNILKGLGFGFLVVAFVMTMGVGSADAALTVAVNAITESGALTINGAAGSAFALAASTTTGAVALGDAMTTGNLTVGTALTTGTVAIGGASHTGTTTISSGATTTDALDIGASTVTTGNGVDLTLAGLTTGKGLDMSDLDAITTGKAIHVDATGVTQTTGVLVHVDSASTALTGAGRLLLVDHTAATSNATGIVAEVASTANDETTIFKVTGSAALALGVGVDVSLVAMTTGKGIDMSDLDAITTGKAIHVDATGITQTDGILVHVDSASTALTATGRLLLVDHTGNAGVSTIVSEIKSAAADETEILKVTSSAILTGPALNVVANSVTGNVGVARISATALTSGTGLLITGSAPGTMTNAGSFLRIADDTVNVFRIGENGHIAQAQAAAPDGTTGTCTTDSVSATSTDTHGEITATCNNQTAIVAFNIAYAAAPHCVVSPMNAAATANVATTTYTVATTGITITQTGNIGAEIWAYMCME